MSAWFSLGASKGRTHFGPLLEDQAVLEERDVVGDGALRCVNDIKDIKLS